MPSNKSDKTAPIADDISINQLRVDIQEMFSNTKNDIIARVKVSIKEEIKKIQYGDNLN